MHHSHQKLRQLVKFHRYRRLFSTFLQRRKNCSNNTVQQLHHVFFFDIRQLQNKKNFLLNFPSCHFNTSLNGNGNQNDHPPNKELGESTLLLQQGSQIQEVPVAVLRDSVDCKSKGKGPKPFIKLDASEESAFVEGFNSFHTPQEVLSILHTIPSQEVTPVVALSILRKLFELENNFGFRNEGKFWVITTKNSTMETFARMAIVSRLIDILILGEDTSVLLDALEMLRYDRKSIAANCIRNGKTEDDEEIPVTMESDILEFSKYRSKLCDEVLIRTTKGQLSLEEVCRAICTMGQISQLFANEIPNNFVDKMWVGISDKSDENIKETNIASVFRTIQYFQKSQRVIMSIAERKFLEQWWRIDTATVAEICDVLLMKDSRTSYNSSSTHHYWGIVSNRLLACMSKCVSMNLHQLTEDELLQITKTFHALSFCDAAFEKTLSKFVKVKCLKISNPNLVTTIMDYVKKFRIRSSHIMEGVAEYFLLHNSNTTTNLSPPQLSSILVPYGLLYYQPPHALKFWEVMERLLQEKFVQMQPKDIIDSLLSCLYLQKYPLNFVNRLFSPYFLDRLHTSETNISLLHDIRSRFKLLDTSMTLECGNKYNGPYLPRDFTAKSVYVDGRIIRMVYFLQETLAKIYDTSYEIEPSVVLPNLPLNPLYIVDVVISPKTGRKVFETIKTKEIEDGLFETPKETESIPVVLKNRFNLRKPDSDYYVPIENSGGYTAILINIPEHYSYDGKVLIGPQIMRIRHLKLLGFNVVNLSYDSLVTMRGKPDTLLEFLKTNLKI